MWGRTACARKAHGCRRVGLGMGALELPHTPHTHTPTHLVQHTCPPLHLRGRARTLARPHTQKDWGEVFVTIQRPAPLAHIAFPPHAPNCTPSPCPVPALATHARTLAQRTPPGRRAQEPRAAAGEADESERCRRCVADPALLLPGSARCVALCGAVCVWRWVWWGGVRAACRNKTATARGLAFATGVLSACGQSLASATRVLAVRSIAW